MADTVIDTSGRWPTRGTDELDRALVLAVNDLYRLYEIRSDAATDRRETAYWQDRSCALKDRAECTDPCDPQALLATLGAVRGEIARLRPDVRPRAVVGS